MLKKNYWLRSGAYTMMQRIAAFVFGFGSYFFLVRYFSIETFGIWTLYLVVSTSVEMSRSAFIQNAFVKFFNEKEIDRSKLFTSSLILNLLSTVFFVILLLALTPVLQSFWKSTIIGGMILWYCVTSVILIPFTQLNYLEQANHSFAGVFWSTVVRQGSFFCIVVGAYVFFPNLSLLFFAAMHSFCALLGLLTAYSISRKMLPAKYLIDWTVIKRLFKFGKYILGTGITSTLGKNASQFILGGISHGLVAMYDAAVRILNFIEIPTLSISSIVYPKIAERASKEGKESVGQLYEKSVASILALILPVIIFAFVFPEFVLTITAGKKYLEAAGALRIMLLASMLLPFNVQLGTVFEVINKPHISFYINLVSNLLNVLLNLTLIHFFGIIGAAYAFAITIFFICLVGQWYVNSFLGVQGFRIFIKVFDVYRDALKHLNKMYQSRATR
jgi:O-antigen/teichoic acid export membrane protein